MQGVRLTLLTAQLCGIHRLAQDLDGHGAGLLQCLILLVVLLKQTLCASIVGSNACGLPTTVIPTGVALVQLELTEVIPTGIDERHTERTETTVLGITLLQVTKPTHKLFARNVFVVGDEVALGVLPGVVDQDVGVSVHTGDGADHVTGSYISSCDRRKIDIHHISNKIDVYLLVDCVELLSGGILFQQLASHLPFGGEDNSILG